MVVGSGDIGSGKTVHSSHIVDAANSRRYRGQQQIANPVQAAVLVGNVGILPVKAEVAASLRRLRNVALQIVDLDAGLEGVVAVYLGYAVHAFDAPDILQCRGVVAHAEVGESADGNGRKAAVIGHLLHSLDAVLRGNSEGVAVEGLLQLVAVNHADMHFVGERGSEDARITHGPCVGRQAVVAATRFLPRPHRADSRERLPQRGFGQTLRRGCFWR